MQPPATPRYRFPSPDDDLPRTTSAARAPFATPAPLTARRRPDANVGAASATRRTPAWSHRGLSPDPDLFTPRTAQPKSKRRRSFDLDEIDEALLSGKPRVLGPSSSGWKHPGGGAGEVFAATPTPAARRARMPGVLMKRAETVLSSPPPNPELSFGDTQEDVQDDGDSEGESARRRRKKARAATDGRGVFDDIESIASSLPSRGGEGDGEGEEQDEEEEEGEGAGSKGRENVRPRKSMPPLTPPRGRANPFAGGATATSTAATGADGKRWIAVPNQPQLHLPRRQGSPDAKKLDQAICAMAWSPSHRRRRNANARYLTGGMAATVLGWAYDAQDAVLRSNAVIEQGGSLQGGYTMVVGAVCGEEENYVAVEGDARDLSHKADGRRPEDLPDGPNGRCAERVMLIGDANSAMRRGLGEGSRVEVRAPTWEVAVGGERWTVVVNWKASDRAA